MRWQTIIIVGLTLAGFTLRLHYLLTSHPFFDEYTTVLAARETLHHGWPILPSGLFYEHGLLATYLIAPFTALFINLPIAEWQPAHWGLMLARWPSAVAGTFTVPLIYAIGRRGLTGPAKTGAALLAAGLFALSPEGIVWGGRARMYALATLLVLLTVYLAYRGATHPAPARYRWWALLALLAALLTQFGAMLLLPPLLVAMLVVGWLSHRTVTTLPSLLAPRSPLPPPRPWFLRRAILLEGAALVAVILLSIWVKRLGQPLGAAALDSLESDQLTSELLNTVTYQTAFYFSWPDTINFLARQFGVPHHFWLTMLTLVGTMVGLVAWLIKRNQNLEIRNKTGQKSKFYFSISNFFYLFLWLTFGLIIVEMVTLLEPFRRNSRYLVMFLPLFYLIAGNAIFNLRLLLNFSPQLHSSASSPSAPRSTLHAPHSPLPAPRSSLYPLSAVALLILLTLIGLPDLRVALLTPEPAYEAAFAWLAANRQPGDTILTMNTPAAGLYLGGADGFTVQTKADQFLLNADSRPVDRWLGVPWIGRATEFNAALNNSEQSWFVIDAIRQPVYFRGDWLAVVNSQLEQVWASDNAIIYRTRPDRHPIPTEPTVIVNANLNHTIQLIGYTSQTTNQSTNQPLHLTLFWQSLTSVPIDYTTFVHLRDPGGATVAQYDGQPLAGVYPTSRWQPDEVVIDPISLALPPDLPAGQYKLYAGLYQLDTLARLPVVNDSSGENAIFLGEVTLP